MISARQQLIVEEMGLGPVWRLRESQALDSPASEVAEQAAVEIAPEPVKPQALVAAADAAEIMQRATPGSVSPVALASADPTSVDQLDWSELAQRVSHCQACGLCQTRKQTVFGVGDQQARWLFVGEGPGYNENLQGQPFVGEAGKLLDNMLRALNLQRGEATYIANIVKCRPTDAQGKDRPPGAEEIQACLPYLQRQIALIQPEVIVALGKTAAIALLGLDVSTPVSQLRGKVHQYQGIPLVATYHPAYLLRQPQEKARAWQDLCQARAQLTQPST